MSLFRRASATCPQCGRSVRRDLGERKAGPKIKKAEMKCPACKTAWEADLDPAWWVLHRNRQGRVRRVRVGPDLRAARKVEAGILVAKVEGRYLDPEEECKTTLAELAEMFGNAFEAAHPNKPRNVQSYRAYIGQAVRLIGGSVRLDQIDSKAIEDYRSACVAERKKNGKPLATASINRRLAVLGSALSYAVRRGLLSRRPRISLPLVDNATNVFLSHEQARALVEACQPEGAWLGRFVRWALATGMRKGEILAMEWGWIDLQRGLLSIPAWATKKQRGRVLPLNRTMKAVLAECEAERAAGLPVLHFKGGPLPPDLLRSAFIRSLARAKLAHMRVHDLRHCAAGFMAEASVDLFRLAMTLGHANLAEVRRYANLQPNHLREAMEATEVDPLPAPPPAGDPAKPAGVSGSRTTEAAGEAGSKEPPAPAKPAPSTVPQVISRVLPFPERRAVTG